jgi:hypothetical protein
MVLFQGIAWIDEADFRIVRLRTDLLAPRPDIFLKTLTSNVRFFEVRIPVQGAAVSLWMPQQANITWDFKGESGAPVTHLLDFPNVSQQVENHNVISLRIVIWLAFGNGSQFSLNALQESHRPPWLRQRRL